MNNRARTVAVQSLAGLSVAALMLASMDRTINAYDEGVIYTAAMRVAAGAIPHRDFYANYGPAQFYLVALLFKIFHPAVIVARVWGCVIKAALALLAFRVVRRGADRPTALLSAIVVTLWLCLADLPIWPAWAAMVLVLLGALPLMTYLSGAPGRWNLLSAGLSVGGAFLFRYDIGLLVLCAEAGVLLLHAWLVSKTPRDGLIMATRALGSYLLGAAMVIFPLLAWFAANGALGELFFDVFQFAAKNYAATRGLPFPVPTSLMLPASLSEYIVYAPLIISLSALANVIVEMRSRSAAMAVNELQNTWTRLLLVALTMAFFAKGVVRVSLLHMSPAIIVASLLVPALRLDRRRPLLASLAALAILSFGLPSLFSLEDLWYQFGKNRDWLAVIRSEAASSPVTKAECASLACNRRSSYLALDSSRMQAVNYVLAHSTPDDALFSGLPKTDRVFVNDVTFYFLADRRPATKWYHYDAGLQNTAEIQTAIIKDLTQTRPKFVLLNAEWDFVREPNDSARSSGVFLLDTYISSHYHAVEKYGPISVLELESQSAEKPPR